MIIPYNKNITKLLRVHLGSAYFAETKNFLLKIQKIKVKVSWNNTVRLMNNIKSAVGPIDNSKN